MLLAFTRTRPQGEIRDHLRGRARHEGRWIQGLGRGTRTMSDRQPLLIIAAGGTGGHMFPAQALAEVMLRRGWRVTLSTDARGARYTGGFPMAVEIEQVASATFARGGALAKAAGALPHSGRHRSARPAACAARNPMWWWASAAIRRSPRCRGLAPARRA
jgi:hypothetical protein